MIPHGEYILFRMTRIIMVMDIELPKRKWILRQRFMLTYLTSMLNEKPISGNFETRETNMHGIRLVFKDEKEFTRLIEQKSNLPITEGFPAITFEIQSESEFASIFFVQWPVNKLSLFSKKD